jgi:hypothetical protein
MATQSEYWQAYLKAHSLIFDYEEEHGLLSAEKFKAKFNKIIGDLLNPAFGTIEK